MTTDIVPKKRVSLAEHAAIVEAICNQIDDNEDEELPEGLIQKFMEANLDLARKTDNWIGLLDAVKARINLLDDMKLRVKKALKAAKTLDQSMKDYVKFVIAGTEGRIPLKGTVGTLYAHSNPEGLHVTVKTTEKAVYHVVDPAMPDWDQSMLQYCRQVTFLTLDKDKVRADLKAGMKLPWAELVRDFHVRIKG